MDEKKSPTLTTTTHTLYGPLTQTDGQLERESTLEKRDHAGSAFVAADQSEG